MSRAQELLRSATRMFGHDKHAAREWAVSFMQLRSLSRKKLNN
jgi:hypothetical protein